MNALPAATSPDDSRALTQARERGEAAGRGKAAQNEPATAIRRGLAHLQKGELDAAARQFHAVLARRPHHAVALINLGSVRVRQRDWEAAVEGLSHALALAPKALPAHVNLIQAYLGAQTFPLAMQAIELALSIFPDNTLLISSRGDALRGLRRLDEAIADLDTAVAREPNDATHRVRRANCLVDLGRHEQARDDYERLSQADRDKFPNGVGLSYLRTGDARRALTYFDAAIARGCELAASWANKGTAHLHLGQWPQSFQAQKMAIELNPKGAELFCNMSLLLLLVGEYEQGLEMYEWRFRLPNGKPQVTGAPRWDGKTDLRGKTLFVAREQGAGDMIQFARYLPKLIAQGVRVVLESPAPLKPLMKSVDPALIVIDNNQRPTRFDAWIELMSLPYVLGTRLDTIPPSSPAYVHAAPERIALWQSRIPATDRTSVRHLGFTWQGNAQHTNDANRSVDDVRLLAPLFALPDTYWHCLQVAISPEDRVWLAAQPNVSLWDGELTDYAETAALIAVLERVVAVDTSVAHLAGALDKPVALLLAKAPDWRWLVDRSDSPWYASARLYRQPAYQDWAGAIAALREDLKGPPGGAGAPGPATPRAEAPAVPAASIAAAPAQERDSVRCKICAGETALYGVTDFNKNCEERNGTYLALTGVPIYYRQCRDCGLVFTDALDDWTPEDFAANIYNAQYIQVDPDYQRVRPMSLARTVTDLAGKLRAAPASRRLLDYGAGDGLMARTLTESGLACDAWDPFGQAGQRTPATGGYDLVTAFEVFEHTTTPIQTVTEVLGYAKKGGVVLFSTLTIDKLPPHAVHFWYISPRNGHVTIYTREALARLFKRFGWAVHSFSDGMHLAYRGDFGRLFR